jgi:predicted short-subunit dehydrogenase-like oxidoreductase (DUF2520 family)
MKFAVIGSGNVAWHYSKMLSNAGFSLTKAYARNPEKWKICYAEFPQVVYSELTDIHTDVDFVLLAVTDHQIVSVAQQIHKDAVILHPSGATDATALAQNNWGVIWGIYSFVQGQALDYAAIPFCIEGSNDQTQQLIRALLKNISDKVYPTTLKQRQQAHVAAVFGNNFITLLLQESFDLLKEANLPEQLIQPTLLQLVQGIENQQPAQLQTGPAKRGDVPTLDVHLALLSHTPEWQETYLHLTNVLLKKYGHSKL